MKNLIFALLFTSTFEIGLCQDVPMESEPRSSFGITMHMENAFGFYPVMYGSFEISPSVDLTFYGVMWTNPSFGMPFSTFSSDLWLENSVGIGFNAFEGVYVNPSLGFTHGKFLSGGEQSVAFEGIVPSLSVYLNSGAMDTEIFFSLYQNFRDEVTDPVNRSTADMIFYWLTPGFWVGKNVALGVHYEGLFLKFGDGDYLNSYQWLGPFLKFRIKDKYELRFMAGPNLEKGIYADEFYKLTTNINLE